MLKMLANCRQMGFTKTGFQETIGGTESWLLKLISDFGHKFSVFEISVGALISSAARESVCTGRNCLY